MKNEIGWCDMTWNPGVYGCEHVSPACSNCYAASMAHRLTAMGVYPEGITSAQPFSGIRWTGKVVTEAAPLTYKLPRRKHAFVFTTSMADLFHQDVPEAFLVATFEAMRLHPHLTFLVLTKRSERMRLFAAEIGDRWPGNVWAGVTCERDRYRFRLADLATIPAPVRFVSAEPLLGPLDLGPYTGAIQWVITGGESGRRARPTNPAWARALRDQCREAGIAFWFKQWGEWIPDEDAQDVGWTGYSEPYREDGGAERHSWPGRPIAERLRGHAGRDHFPGEASWRLGRKYDPQTLDRAEHRERPVPG